MLTVGELFAGIGGIGLGLENTGGFQVKWQVERDEYASKVLAKHWPEVQRFEDVREFPPGDKNNYYVDLIAGGFPCQDISLAGKGEGLKGERSGLFYEIVRIAERLKPKYLLLENVAALLVRGMGDVLRELAAVGYDAEWHCIPAAAVGAPHRRDRVFIIAYAEHIGPHRNGSNEQERQCEEMERSEFARGNGGDRDVADTDSDGRFQMPQRKPIESSTAKSEVFTPKERTENLYTNPGGAGWKGGIVKTILRVEGLQGELERIREDVGRRQWEIEPALGRVVDGFPGRVDQLRCLGNAVVPQVAQFLGEMILRAEQCKDS